MAKRIIQADILLIARICNSQNISAYYLLNHRIRCIYFTHLTVYFKKQSVL